MQDEWTKKERNKMQQGGGTTMSEEWRDAESLVASVILHGLQLVVLVLHLKNRIRKKFHYVLHSSYLSFLWKNI